MKSRIDSFRSAIQTAGWLVLCLTLMCAQQAQAERKYAAVLFGGDYPGPPAFDDHLSLSSKALAAALATWPNWKRGAGGNIDELDGGATPKQFLDAITPYTATGAKALGDGDFFLLFYFGHGGPYGGFLDGGVAKAANERAPAYDKWEEGLSFPTDARGNDELLDPKLRVLDNALTAKFQEFAPGVMKVFINISCHSGGFWNGNNPGGAGDLEQVPNTILMASSPEPWLTFAGNLPPRRWEPRYLHNLIANLNRNGRASMTLAQWHYRSFVPGTVTGFRFDEPREPAYYGLTATGDEEEYLNANTTASTDITAAGSPPALAITLSNGLVTVSWPPEYIGSRLQQTPGLTPALWSDVANSTTTNLVVLNASANKKFFRLCWAAPDLEVTKVGAPNPVNVGGLLTYTISVTNRGSVTASNVVLVDTLPENLLFVAANSSQGTLTNGETSIDCLLGDLPTGQQATVTLIVKPTTAGVVSNTATVMSDNLEANWANNRATAFNTVLGTAVQYSILPSAGAHGTIYPPTTLFKNAGERQFFSADADPGYWPDQWLVDGLPAQIGGSAFVLSNIQTNHTILVTFRTSQYIIEVEAATNGTVSPEGIIYKDPGASQDFTATPDPNYTVNSWLLDEQVVQTGGNTFTVSNIQTNHYVSATFRPLGSSQPRIDSSSGPNGSVSPGGSFLVNPGTNLVFTATPGNGYAVALWYLNGTAAQTNGSSFLMPNVTTDAQVFVTFNPPVTNASVIGAEPPAPASSVQPSESGAAISLTEGNLIEQYAGPVFKSAFGPTLDFYLTYNSYNADGSRAHLDATVGYGWTHSFNIFLFRQSTNLFRFDANGRVTKYTLQAGGALYRSAAGYFETIADQGAGILTLTNKEKTVLAFSNIAGTPFTVGSAVYRLFAISDRNSNTTWLSYTNGNLTAITDTYGRSLILSNNPSGHLVSVTDPLGRSTMLEYDASGAHLTAITDPLGNRVNYAYNPLHQLSQKVDKDGRLFTFTYQSGKPVGITDAVGQPLFTLSNPLNWATQPAPLANNQLRVYQGGTTTKTDGNGNAWTYQYNNNGYLMQVFAPDGAMTRYTYDGLTLMTSSMTDANNHVTTNRYDALGNRVNTTDALGNVTSFTYETNFSQMTSLIDPNRRTNVFQLDARGNRTNAIDALGQAIRYTYDTHGNLLSITDKRTNTTSHLYDATGNRTNTTDALGFAVRMTHDTMGNLKTLIDANNHAHLCVYDALDRLVQEIDPLGSTILTGYDHSGNRTSVTDANANTTHYVYDQRQRLVQKIDAVGQISSYAYDGNNNRTNATDRNGHWTTFVYDSQNRVTQVINALGYATATVYDPVGNVLTNIDARGFPTAFQYDALNRSIARMDPVSNSLLLPCVTTFDYATNGSPSCCLPTLGSSLVTKQTDCEGKVTYYKYDALDRLILEVRKQGDTADVIDSDDAATGYAYDANGNRTHLTNAIGNVTAFRYDVLNRQTNIINAMGDSTRTTYDGVGNVLTVTAPNGNITTNVYDPRDRLIRASDRVGLLAAYTYDPAGNRLTQTDGNTNTTANGYDPINRLVSVTDALLKPSFNVYDAEGNLTTFVDRSGNSTLYAYDALNRRIQTIDPLLHTNTASYDAANNVVSLVDGRGNTNRFDYDGLNRRVAEIYPDGQPPRIFRYDGLGNVIQRQDQRSQTTSYGYDDLYHLTNRAYSTGSADQFSYDLAGRMLSAAHNGWMVTFAYDDADRLISTVQNGQPVSYLYNIPARLRVITYPDGRVISETSDFRDRLKRVDDTNSPTAIVQYAYDAGNRVTLRTCRNGIVSTQSYNSNDWTTILKHGLGTNLIAGFGYAYDAEGNQLSESNLLDAALSETYAYDARQRLTNFVVGPCATAWDLDAEGNWNSKTGACGTDEFRNHNAAEQITDINGVPLYYDPNGNLINDATNLYSYDEENRLMAITRVADGQLIGNYAYDALGRRVSKFANADGLGAQTFYFYDGDRIIAEQVALGFTTATYVYGNGIDELPTVTRGAGINYYFYQNALGSVVAATSNETSFVAERYRYDAYGQPMITDDAGAPVPINSWGTPHSAIAVPALFTGRQLDEESGEYCYRARSYDPLKGRFLQRDPLGFVDSLNLYEYVDDRPTFFADPSGCQEKPTDIANRFIKGMTNSINSNNSIKEATKEGFLRTLNPDEQKVFNARAGEEKNPKSGRMTVTPLAGKPGDTVTVSLAGFPAGASVNIDFGTEDRIVARAVMILPNGTARATFTVPAQAAAIPSVMKAAGGSPRTVAWEVFTVLKAK